jgi:hypothetical protein
LLRSFSRFRPVTVEFTGAVDKSVENSRTSRNQTGKPSVGQAKTK